MQGQYTELIVIQENTSDGSETFLWSSESPDFLGTYGWKEFKLSFFWKASIKPGKGICYIVFFVALTEKLM